MNVDGRVIKRIRDLIKIISRWLISFSALKPGMATSVAISRRNDELFSPGRADGSDGSLVVFKNEGG